MEIGKDDALAGGGKEHFDPECIGPEPPPWLPWNHCFRMYEFRLVRVPLRGKQAVRREAILIRVRYEHALCLMGRKQGPIVHTLTLLPLEQVRIFEYDRYRRATSATARFSQRSSFYNFAQQVNTNFNSTKVSAGASSATQTSGSGGGGGGIDLGIISFGAEASFSSASQTSQFLNASQVSESFAQVTQVSAQAVETERSIVVSTFEDQESIDTTARTLRNDNPCRAVTYYVRRVFEVYSLTTKIVAIEAQAGDHWVPLDALDPELHRAVKSGLGEIKTGQRHDPKIEIPVPTDGLLYEAELAHCCSCDPIRESRLELENRKLAAEIELMVQEAGRRKALIVKGDLGPFEPCCPEVDEA